MKTVFAVALVFLTIFALPSSTDGQTRDEMVHNDRDRLKDDQAWYYDDLESGLIAARRDNKPLMVVLRCIP